MIEQEKELVEDQEETVAVEDQAEETENEVEDSTGVDGSTEQDESEQEQDAKEEDQEEQKEVVAAKPGDSSAFRQMRQANREKAKRIKELEKQVAELKPKEQPLGIEPTLEDCEYDAEKFKAQYREWLEKKSKREAEIKAQERQDQEAQAAWQTRLSEYSKQREATVAADPDFEEAEENVQDALTQTQQGILLKGAKHATAIIAKLGKDPALLETYAKIQDPVEFAFAIAELGVSMKQPVKNQITTPPERKIRGNAGAVGSAATLAKLREEAERTGDFSKVLNFRRQTKTG